MAKTNPLTNLWLHILWKTWEPSRIKKPIRLGYKFWVLAEQYGYVIQLDLCQGTKSEKHLASKTRWGLGEVVILCLMESLPTKVKIITSSWTIILLHFGYWCILVSMRSKQQPFSTRKSSIIA